MMKNKDEMDKIKVAGRRSAIAKVTGLLERAGEVGLGERALLKLLEQRGHLGVAAQQTEHGEARRVGQIVRRRRRRRRAVAERVDDVDDDRWRLGLLSVAVRRVLPSQRATLKLSANFACFVLSFFLCFASFVLLL